MLRSCTQVGDEDRLSRRKSMWALIAELGTLHLPMGYAVLQKVSRDHKDDYRAQEAGNVGDDKPVRSAERVTGQHHERRV